jgi:hypothetical protein
MGIVFAAGTFASPFLLAQSSNQAQKNSSMHMNDMQQCRTQCRQTEGSIDKTIKLMDDAKQSGDPGKMRTAMDEAEKNLSGMKDHMSKCMNMMDMMQNMHNKGMMSGHEQSPGQQK